MRLVYLESTVPGVPRQFNSLPAVSGHCTFWEEHVGGKQTVCTYFGQSTQEVSSSFEREVMYPIKSHDPVFAGFLLGDPVK